MTKFNDLNNNNTFFMYGGERGIRTLETVSCLHAFQACAFSHSATSPLLIKFKKNTTKLS